MSADLCSRSFWPPITPGSSAPDLICSRSLFVPLKSRRCLLAWGLATTILTAGLQAGFGKDTTTFEAESGSRGADWAVSNTSPAYITILTDGAGYNPGSAARVATYTVTFPAAGTYQLYARIRVGPGAFNDDSMFYASSFGSKLPALNSDWAFVNGLAAAGFSNSTDVVTGSGTLGSGMWKWINLSQFAGSGSFSVSSGSLTQTFQVGARETGLDLDKFVFGALGTAFTVSNLDTGTDPVTITLTNAFPGPEGMAIHRFNPLTGNLNLDGANPVAGLELAGSLLCGTTLNGGAQGAGTAFYITPDGSNFSAFHSFTNAPDAGNPRANLIVSGRGFFGTSFGGGNHGVGAVFLGQTNGSISMIRSFSALDADTATNSGGASPNGAVVISGGTLYGTMTAGGFFGHGTVFSLATNASTFAVLHDFTALDCQAGTNADGAAPWGGLVLAGDTLFGTASGGGAEGSGTLFSVRTNGSNFTTLYNFTSMDPVTGANRDGAVPFGSLLLCEETLYGTTAAGGEGSSGVIFAAGTNGSSFRVLHSFSAVDPLTRTNSDGARPVAALVRSGNALYGTTAAGANGSGGVFSMNTNGSRFKVIYRFGGTDPGTGTNSDGAYPVAGLLLLSNSLYGTTFAGGPGAAGTVFRLPLPPAVITNATRNPDSSLTLLFDGNPGSTNFIQAASNLAASGSWQTVATNVADATGLWRFTETNTSLWPARFYRSYSP